MTQKDIFEKEIYVDLYNDVIQDLLDMIRDDKIKFTTPEPYDIFRNLVKVFFRYISKTRWYKGFSNKESLMFHIQAKYNTITNDAYKDLKKILNEKEEKLNPFANITIEDNNIIKDLIENNIEDESMDIERNNDISIEENKSIILNNNNIEIENINKNESISHINNNIDMSENEKKDEISDNQKNIKSNFNNLEIMHKDFSLLREHSIFYTEENFSNIRKHIYVFYFNNNELCANHVNKILDSSNKIYELVVFDIKNRAGIKYYFVYTKFVNPVQYKKELFGTNITKNPFIRAERIKDVLADYGDIVFLKQNQNL